MRMNVKVAASILVSFSAARQRSELLANAIIANRVRKKMRALMKNYPQISQIYTDYKIRICGNWEGGNLRTLCFYESGLACRVVARREEVSEEFAGEKKSNAGNSRQR